MSLGCLCRYHACYCEAILGTTPTLRESHSIVVSDLFRKVRTLKRKNHNGNHKMCSPFFLLFGGDDGSMTDEVMEV